MRFTGLRSRAAATQLAQVMAVCGGLAVLLAAIALVMATDTTPGARTAEAVLLTAVALLIAAALVAVVAFLGSRDEEAAAAVMISCRRRLRLLAVGGIALLVVVLVIALIVTRPSGHDIASILLAVLAATQTPLALFLLSR